jgi:hypothetical protein
MGLNQHFLGLLIGLQRQGYLNGRRVVEIGAQQMSDAFLSDSAAVEELAALFGTTADKLHEIPGSAAGLAHIHRQHAGPFYQALGYEYACIDIDGTRGAIPFDLNYDEVPPQHLGQFDLVTNCGTTEHVMNQLNAFKAIHDLAAVNAVMIHELPAQGMIDHGLFSYSPKFFRLLGEQNDYETLFLDYRWSEVRYGLPENLKFKIEKFVSVAGRPLCGASDTALFVAQRKTRMAPFVPPIDVPIGTKAPSEIIADRYWPVFKPPGGIRALRRLIRRAIIMVLTRR